MKQLVLIFLLLSTFIVNSKSEIISDNQEIISLIENNWNSIKTMSGRFEQTDTDNNIEYGNFYFDKPYKSKFTYDNKNETIITNQVLININHSRNKNNDNNNNLSNLFPFNIK